MANRYFSSVSMTKHQEAAIFSDPYTWKVLDILREAGGKGLTAKEVQEKLESKMGVSVSASKLYGLLRRLYMEDWVHRYYDKDVEAQRMSSAFHWGTITTQDRRLVYEEFEDKVLEKEASYIKQKLFPMFSEYLEKVVNDFTEDPAMQKFMPQRGKANFCIDCHTSHEAIEFFNCLLYIATDQFIDESSQIFDEFLKKNTFEES